MRKTEVNQSNVTYPPYLIVIFFRVVKLIEFEIKRNKKFITKFTEKRYTDETKNLKSKSGCETEF